MAAELQSATEFRSKVVLVCLLNSIITFQFPRCTTTKSPWGKVKILFTEDTKLFLYQIVLYLQGKPFQLRHNKPLLFDLLLLSLCVLSGDFKSQHIMMGTALASLHNSGIMGFV